ncbi:hypothetical protein D046_1324A, partial [Vibrio parahaemolyticus V-223/04]
MVTEIATGK